MRTYILSMRYRGTSKRVCYYCQASSFADAIAKAQKAIPGFPNLPGDQASEVRNGTLDV